MKTYETKEAAEKDADFYQFLYEQHKQRDEEREVERMFHSSLKNVFSCFAATIATILIVTDMQMTIWKSACALLFVLIPVSFCIHAFEQVFNGIRWTRKLCWKWVIIFFLLATVTLCLLTHKL